MVRVSLCLISCRICATSCGRLSIPEGIYFSKFCFKMDIPRTVYKFSCNICRFFEVWHYGRHRICWASSYLSAQSPKCRESFPTASWDMTAEFLTIARLPFLFIKPPCRTIIQRRNIFSPNCGIGFSESAPIFMLANLCNMNALSVGISCQWRKIGN
jgi:hypothetical protein